MDHVKALAIKFIFSLALLYVILGLVYGMTFGQVFLITLVLGGASYIIGDMLILPRTNNFTATIADFGLAFMVIWLMSKMITNGAHVFGMSLVAAIGVALFELAFHVYVRKAIIEDTNERHIRSTNLQYQTEASKEFDDPREREDR
ncbi:YndM family protein [bacterium LRH843]|nr:YndM family protein [bacterium LRH843]